MIKNEILILKLPRARHAADEIYEPLHLYGIRNLTEENAALFSGVYA